MRPPELSLTAIREMRIELDSIAREHESRPKAAARDDLVKRAQDALAGARTIRVPEFLAAAATRLAALLNDTGRPAEARCVIEENAPLPGGLSDHPLGVSFDTQHVRAIAALARAESDPSRSAVLWREVDGRTSALIGLVEERRARVSVPDLFSAFTRFSIDVYALAVESRVALGDLEGALSRIELVKCRSIHRLQSQQRDGVNGAELRAEFRNLSRAIDEVQRAGGSAPNDLLARRRAIWDLLAIDRFAEQFGTFSGFALSAFQARLPAGTVAISWFWLDCERFLVAAVSAEQFTMCLRPVGEAVRRDIDETARRILSFAPGDSTTRTKLRSDLANVLIPPDVRNVMTAGSRLILSPHRSLHALPLHALPWHEGRPLIRHYAISYAPNLTTLLAPDRARSRRDVMFVGIPRRADGLRGQALEGTLRECLDLTTLYGTDLATTVGPAATEDALRSLDDSGGLERFGAFHFACHGVNIDSDNPMESKLLLYDSELDGLDISQWRLDADLIVLSACSAGQRPVSGRGLTELPGDEVFGLQAAFFAAGARAVLATQWPVGDDVAPAVCGAFHEHWRRLPADIALQGAICDYLDFHGRIMERTPHTWACFFLTTVRMPERCHHEEHP